MEEILSSIKRIIAEEGDTPTRGRRPARGPAAPPAVPADEQDDEVLELSDPIPVARHQIGERAPSRGATPAEPAPVAPTPAAETPTQPILSQQTAQASRGALESLSRLVVKPDPASDGTLEGLVRDMLRPMLREWLDANLPAMVETMVAREIARITSEAQ